MLKVQGLRIRYGQREAVHGLDFEVRAGEIVTLVGSNGAGKTTTLKAISGVLRIVGGAVEFEGRRIDGLPPHAIIERGVAHVPEGRLLFKDMTVLEHLERVLDLAPEGDGQALDAQQRLCRIGDRRRRFEIDLGHLGRSLERARHARQGTHGRRNQNRQ